MTANRFMVVVVTAIVDQYVKQSTRYDSGRKGTSP